MHLALLILAWEGAIAGALVLIGTALKAWDA